MGELLMFYGTECVHCHEMLPLLDRLEEEEHLVVKKIETWHNSKNTELLRTLDTIECGGVPFFYNENTKKTLCGAVPFERLKKWALGL